MNFNKLPCSIKDTYDCSYFFELECVQCCIILKMCNHEIDFQEKYNNFDSYMYSAVSLFYLKLETIILACVEFCIVFIFLIWIQFIDMYLLCFYRPHRMVQAQRKFAKRHPLSPNRYKIFFLIPKLVFKKTFQP